MNFHRSLRWFTVLGIGLLAGVILIYPVGAGSASIPTSQEESQVEMPPELGTAQLRLEDLPVEFAATPGEASAWSDMLQAVWGSQTEVDSMAMPLNWTAYRLGDQLVVSGLLAPLSESEQASLGQMIGKPEDLLERLLPILGEGDQTGLETGGLGEAALNLTTSRRCGTTRLVSQYAVALRGPVLLQVLVLSPESTPPGTDGRELARLLDERVLAALSVRRGPYRSSGAFIPDFTTYIPTPLDISREPPVLGANLFLAALAMLPFAWAVERFNALLAEWEQAVGEHWRRPAWLARLQEGWQIFLKGRLRNRRLRQLRELFLRLLSIFLFYGLVFSLLERDWRPFSLEGLALFGTMLVAYCLVGLVDDWVRLWQLRRWKKKDVIVQIRPTNSLLSLISVGLTRLLPLSPGLMFGSPEALDFDEDLLKRSERNRLLLISILTITLTWLLAWLPTFITDLQLRRPLSIQQAERLGALQATLLIIFAVAMENFFLQVMGHPEGFGKTWRKLSRWQWAAGLVLAAFLFLHTLLNPRGDLSQALGEGNVRLYLTAVLSFTGLTLLLSLGRKWLGRMVRKWALAVVGLGFVGLVVGIWLLLPSLGSSRLASPALPMSSSAGVEATPAVVPGQPATPTSTPFICCPGSDSSGEPELPVEISAWTRLALDSFDDNRSDWQTGTWRDDVGDHQREIRSGRLHLEEMPASGELVGYGLPDLPPLTDFYLQVSVRQLEGAADSELGVVFRFQDPDDFYYLGINSERRLWLQANTGSHFRSLAADLALASYRPCSWNTIGVLAEGTRLAVYVNGELVLEVLDESLAEGSLGIAYWLARPAERLVFEVDNMEVWVP